MAHYANEELKLSFDLPDDPTALEIVTYDSKRIEMAGSPAIIILWECVKPLLLNWSCEVMQDYRISLNKIRGTIPAQVVEWSALRGLDWRLELDHVPKN